MTTTVYLLHFDAGRSIGRHYLGVADGDVSAPPAHVPHGSGVVPAAGARLADVWEMDDPAAAARLLAKFRKQGSRARLCSICAPGNSRGAGRGRYTRRKG